MSIKATFKDTYDLTHYELADMVAQRMKRDGVDMVCDRCCVTVVLNKQARQDKGNNVTYTPKEQKVYLYLLDILEELEHGKAGS